MFWRKPLSVPQVRSVVHPTGCCCCCCSPKFFLSSLCRTSFPLTLSFANTPPRTEPNRTATWSPSAHEAVSAAGRAARRARQPNRAPAAAPEAYCPRSEPRSARSLSPTTTPSSPAKSSAGNGQYLNLLSIYLMGCYGRIPIICGCCAQFVADQSWPKCFFFRKGQTKFVKIHLATIMLSSCKIPPKQF